MKTIKRLAAFALSLFMLIGAAGASETSGIIGDYFDVSTDTSFTVGAELETVMPFGDATVAKLNGVLKHMTLDAGISKTSDGEDISLAISVDGDSVFNMKQRQTGEGFELETSLLPNRTLTGSSDILEALFGAGEQESAFDATAAIAEVQGVYTELTDGITPYAEEKKANYKIKSIGTAKWSRVARLTPEQSAELLPQIAAVLGCGMDAEYRARLAGMTCAKNFTVALYRDKTDGEDIAVYMKGDVTFEDGTVRSLSYQWAFKDGKERKDTYKFELKKKKSPADNRIISATITNKSSSGGIDISGKSETTLKEGKSTVVITEGIELGGKISGSSRTLKGEISTAEKTTFDGKSQTVTATIAPDLTLTSAEGSGALGGAVRLEKKQGKNPQLSVKLTFDPDNASRLADAAQQGTLYSVGDDDVIISMIDPENGVAGEVPAEEPEPAQSAALPQGKPGEPPLGYSAYSVPAQMQTIGIDGASRETLDALTDEMAQRLAGALLIKLAALPGEDAALLTDGMTAEDAQAFMTLLEGI